MVKLCRQAEHNNLQLKPINKTMDKHNLLNINYFLNLLLVKVISNYYKEE